MTARTLILAVALAALAGCKGATGLDGLKVGNLDVGELNRNLVGMQGVSQEEEIAIGQGVTETLLGASPVAPDPELQRYVNTVGRWVALQSGRPDLPWHFVVNDSEVVNAVATPGGNVIVTKGMLRELRNESELAGLLGHEIAHVVRKHHLNAIKKTSFMALLAQGAQVASSNTRSEDLVMALVGPTKQLYARGLDKSDEFEADRMGVVLATRAGYDAWGLPYAIQTLATLKPDDNAVKLLFKTHPSPSARLEQLATVMGTNFDEYANGTQNTERYARMTARVRLAAK